MLRILKGVFSDWSYFAGRAIKETGLALDVYGSKLENDIAWMEPLSRHRTIMPLYGQAPPVIYDSAVIRDNASLIGTVILGDNVHVGYGTVLRADEFAVRVGHNSSIGDHTVIVAHRGRLPNHVLASTTIGQNVQIGDNVVINSAIIDDDVKIGSNTLILDGAQIERGAEIGEDSVVPPGRLIPGNQYWAGNPVEFVRNLDDKQIQ